MKPSKTSLAIAGTIILVLSAISIVGGLYNIGGRPTLIGQLAGGMSFVFGVMLSAAFAQVIDGRDS
jgi:hypothetical protein